MQKSGVTPWFAMNGRNYTSEVAKFGETVLAKVPSELTKSKSDPRWVRGVLTSRTDSSNSHEVLTEDGRGTSRTILRFPHPNNFDEAVFARVTGLPWSVRGTMIHKGQA